MVVPVSIVDEFKEGPKPTDENWREYQNGRYVVVQDLDVSGIKEAARLFEHTFSYKANALWYPLGAITLTWPFYEAVTPIAKFHSSEDCPVPCVMYLKDS